LQRPQLHIAGVRGRGAGAGAGDWADRVSHSPARRHLIRRTGLTGPARPAPAAAPDHVDVAATLLQPPRCHIDVVTRTARTRTAPHRRHRPLPHPALTPQEPHPHHIVPTTGGRLGGGLGLSGYVNPGVETGGCWHQTVR